MNNRITVPATRCPRLAVAVVGLVACAAPSRNAESRPLRATAPGYEAQILVDGVPAPTFWHEGESYVLGHTGQRYVSACSTTAAGESRRWSRSTDATSSTARMAISSTSAAIWCRRGAKSISTDGDSRNRRPRPFDSRRSPTRTQHAPATHARSALSAWPFSPSASIVRTPFLFHQRRRAVWKTIAAATISVTVSRE